MLSASDHVQIEILSPTRGNEAAGEYQVSFDGQKQEPLLVGDIVEVTQASTYIYILKLSERSFVQTLRSKLPD